MTKLGLSQEWIPYRNLQKSKTWVKMQGDRGFRVGGVWKFSSDPFNFCFQWRREKCYWMKVQIEEQILKIWRENRYEIVFRERGHINGALCDWTEVHGQEPKDHLLEAPLAQ